MSVNDHHRDDSRQRDPRLARLYQAAPGEEPPAALDAAILAAARRAVSAGPQAVGGGETAIPVVRVGHVKRNWYVPVSIAAVLVMSVSLVLLVHQEKGDELALPPAMMSGPQSAGAPPKTSAPATAPAADASAAVAPPEKAGLMLRDAAPAKPKAMEEKRTEPVKAIDVAATRKDQLVGGAVREQGPASATASAPVVAREQKPEPFPAAREREAPASSSLPASRDAMEARTRNEPDRSVTRGASVAPAAPVAAPRRAVPAEDALAQSAPSQAEGRVFATPLPPAAHPAPPPAPPPAAKPALRLMEKRPLLWRGLEDQPPEKWLERLTEFKRDGRQADADELWAEFRRRFPDHPASAR